MHRASRWHRGRSIYSLILRQTTSLQVAVFAIGLTLPALAIVPLHMQERIIDDAIPAGDAALAAWLGALFLGAALLRGLGKFAIGVLRGKIAAIVGRVLRAALIDAQRHRSEDHARRSLGTVTSVLTAEVQPLGEFSAEAINTPLIQGGTLAGVFGYMLATDYRLAAIGIAALVAEAILTPIVQHRINLLTAKRIATLRVAGADLIEAATVPGHRGVIVDGLRRVRATYRILLRMNVLKALLKVMRNLIDHTADAAVIVFGAMLVIDGEIGVGVIVAFLSGLREVRGPWGELVSFYRRYADATVKYGLVRRAMNGDGDALAQVIEAQAPTAVPVRGRAD